MFDFARSQRAALRAASRGLGLPFSPARLVVYGRINDALWERYRRGEIDVAALKRERFREYLRATGADPEDAERLARRYEHELSRLAHPFPGCRRALVSLARRFRLGLVTNGLARIQHGRLKASGLSGLFETVVTSEGCGIAKPDPRILEIALRELGVSAREAVYVGDDPAVDQGAARGAGMGFVWVDRGRHEPRHRDRPRRRVTHLREVEDLLV